MLNHKVWALALELDRGVLDTNLEDHIVYKANESKISNDRINDFVGIVAKNSNINKIFFEYLKKQNTLEEGYLLELKIGDKTIFYQVIEGTTDIENLEFKDEARLVKGEAIQLGSFDEEILSFEKYGWVPKINTPIYITEIGINGYSRDYPEYKLGKIPSATIPVVLNLDDSISHHMAFLGITGAGKSFLAIDIIRKIIQEDYTVICVDFTGEWKKRLENDYVNFSDINTVDTSKVNIIELDNVSNTTESLNETNRKLEEIFTHAKEREDENNGVKICLVLEEAHTIVPETSFLGDFGDYSKNKALVNKMTQVALQGRKYGIGLLVIAQRTANVAKTVLTQCNTVVCFQSFDETSTNFLGNYVGKELAQRLSKLKQYHAIVAGKGLKSNVPLIVNLERNEDHGNNIDPSDNIDDPSAMDSQST